MRVYYIINKDKISPNKMFYWSLLCFNCQCNHWQIFWRTSVSILWAKLLVKCLWEKCLAVDLQLYQINIDLLGTFKIHKKYLRRSVIFNKINTSVKDLQIYSAKLLCKVTLHHKCLSRILKVQINNRITP